MKRLSVISSLLVLLSPLHAGTGVTREEVTPLFSASPAVARGFLESFELGPQGEAMRLGKQYGELSGNAVGPYVFLARMKGSGGDWPLEVTLSTHSLFLGPDGKPLKDEGMGAPDGSRVIETLVDWKIGKPDGAEPPAENPDAGGGVEEVRDLYAKVEEMDLTPKETELNWEDEPMSGRRKEFRDAEGKVWRGTLSWGADHGGWLVDVVYDESGAPRFLLLEESSWKFAGAEGQTEDSATQTRFYFSPKRETLATLGKSFTARDGDGDLEKAADDAPNKSLGLPGHHGIRLQNLAAELREANGPKSMTLSDDFQRAIRDLDEPPLPLEPAHWHKVPITKPLVIANEEGADIRVLSYLMENGLVSEANTRQEGNYEVGGMVIEGDPGHSEEPILRVVITASGLMDDAVMAERFLASFSFTRGGEYRLESLGRQSKGWPERGPQGWK